jgi:hypothetical protein
MNGETLPRAAPAAAMALAFWLLLAAFVVFDWLHAPQRNRFDEPPPFAIGSGPVSGAGHCAAVPDTAPPRR